MLYPNFLRKNQTIGITAPSAGVGYKLLSYEKSIKTLQKEGYNIVETESVRNNEIVSTTEEKRAQEFDELVKNKDINMIICATGGDFLLEILPYINLSNIKENPKWIMGYSDPTSLLYLITTKLDIATIYGFNAGSYDQIKIHKSLRNNLEILKGNIVPQKSFKYYQKEENKELDGYNLDEKVYWESINEDFDIKGRLIGGCLDCLKDIMGTPFDNTLHFIEKYKDDGIIWYFDIYELSAEELYRTLFQMRKANWFKYIKGIIVGRVAIPKISYNNFSYQQALKRLYQNLPIAFNTDIGHVPPKMTLINGSIAHIICKNGKGIIKQELKK